MRFAGVLLLACSAAAAQDFRQSGEYFKHLKVLPPETLRPSEPAKLPDLSKQMARVLTAESRPCAIPLLNALRGGAPPSRMPKIQPRPRVMNPGDFVQVPAPSCDDVK